MPNLLSGNIRNALWICSFSQKSIICILKSLKYICHQNIKNKWGIILYQSKWEIILYLCCVLLFVQMEVSTYLIESFLMIKHLVPWWYISSDLLICQTLSVDKCVLYLMFLWHKAKKEKGMSRLPARIALKNSAFA